MRSEIVRSSSGTISSFPYLSERNSVVSKLDSRLNASMTVTVVSSRAMVCRPPSSTLYQDTLACETRTRYIRHHTFHSGSSLRRHHFQLQFDPQPPTWQS